MWCHDSVPRETEMPEHLRECRKMIARPAGPIHSTGAPGEPPRLAPTAASRKGPSDIGGRTAAALPLTTTKKCKFCEDDVPQETDWKRHKEECRYLKERHARLGQSRRVPSAPSAHPAGLPMTGSTRLTREPPTHPERGATQSSGKRDSSQRPESEPADTGRRTSGYRRGEEASFTGKRNASERPSSSQADPTRSSSRRCSDGAPEARVARPAKLRLDRSPGYISRVTLEDAAVLGSALTRLTRKQVNTGRLNVLPVRNVAYWAELNLGGHRLYIVAVLNRHAVERFSSLSELDLQISGAETLPWALLHTMGVSAFRLRYNREVKVRLGAVTEHDDAMVPYILFPLEFTKSRAFVDLPTRPTGHFPVLFWAKNGVFQEYARNRLRQGGTSEATMLEHMQAHAEVGRVPGRGPAHWGHPGRMAPVLHQSSVDAYPRDISVDGDGAMSSDDDVNPALRVPPPRGTDLLISTMEDGTMPCVSAPVRLGPNHWLPVTVYLDDASGEAIMSASAYVDMFCQRDLDGMVSDGEDVHTTRPTIDGVRMVLTSLGKVRLTFDLTNDPHNPVHITLDFRVVEDRNDRGLKMIKFSIPRSVYNAFPDELRTMQRSNLASQAFWQASSKETPQLPRGNNAPPAPNQSRNSSGGDGGGASASRRSSYGGRREGGLCTSPLGATPPLAARDNTQATLSCLEQQTANLLQGHGVDPQIAQDVARLRHRPRNSAGRLSTERPPLRPVHEERSPPRPCGDASEGASASEATVNHPRETGERSLRPAADTSEDAGTSAVVLHDSNDATQDTCIMCMCRETARRRLMQACGCVSARTCVVCIQTWMGRDRLPMPTVNWEHWEDRHTINVRQAQAEIDHIRRYTHCNICLQRIDLHMVDATIAAEDAHDTETRLQLTSDSRMARSMTARQNLPVDNQETPEDVLARETAALREARRQRCHGEYTPQEAPTGASVDPAAPARASAPAQETAGAPILNNPASNNGAAAAGAARAVGSAHCLAWEAVPRCDGTYMTHIYTEFE